MRKVGTPFLINKFLVFFALIFNAKFALVCIKMFELTFAKALRLAKAKIRNCAALQDYPLQICFIFSNIYR